MIDRTQKAPTAPVISGFAQPYKPRKGHDRWSRDELLELTTVLCMLVHKRDYDGAGLDKCPECQRFVEDVKKAGRKWWKAVTCDVCGYPHPTGECP